MKNNYLEKLWLNNYRNFSELELSFNKDIIVLAGQNGSGKTNILEAISLLSPGRGLRSVYFDDLCKIGEPCWKSGFHLRSKIGPAEVTNHFILSERKRQLKYNGRQIAVAELLNLTNIIWLTPQMESLFLSTPSFRRRYLDRVVYNFDTQIAKSLTKYDYYMRERIKALTNHGDPQDHGWLDLIEEKIASEAIYIAKAREVGIAELNRSLENLDSKFPKASLAISQSFEDNISWYAKELESSRKKDEISGRTNFGIHKVDFLVTHVAKNKLAKLCSTGEQKAMLISLTLAQIDAMKNSGNNKPILLLDEIFVHLDKERRDYLGEYIVNSCVQSFITTTEVSHLSHVLADSAQIIEI
jgi:DNA replication and repair protein RecF